MWSMFHEELMVLLHPADSHSLQSLGVEHRPAAIHLQVSPTEIHTTAL